MAQSNPINPKVAVIMPCHNQGQYLADCLESLILQDFQDWVGIVVDDGSLDNTREVGELFVAKENRLSYLWQEKQGPGAARNAGIHKTNSEFILPLDADDYIHPSYLSKTVAALEAHPEVKLIYTGCRFVGEIQGAMHQRTYCYRELLSGNIIINTALFRRSDFLKTSGYDVTLTAWEDWDFWLTLLKPTDKVYKIEEELFFYRRKIQSRNNQLDQEKEAMLRKQIFLNHRDNYNQYFDDPLNLCYRIKILEKQVRDLQRRDYLTRITNKIKVFSPK